jgi:hypothetical protein
VRLKDKRAGVSPGRSTSSRYQLVGYQYEPGPMTLHTGHNRIPVALPVQQQDSWKATVMQTGYSCVPIILAIAGELEATSANENSLASLDAYSVKHSMPYSEI